MYEEEYHGINRVNAFLDYCSKKGIKEVYVLEWKEHTDNLKVNVFNSKTRLESFLEKSSLVDKTIRVYKISIEDLTSLFARE